VVGTYLITTDNKLYVTGLKGYLGFKEDKLEFTLLMENVTDMEISGSSKFIKTLDGIYFLGWNYYGIAPGVGNGTIQIPTKITLPTGYTVANVESMGFGGDTCSFIIMKSGNERKCFISGASNGRDGGRYSGLSSSVSQYTELILNDLVDGEYCEKAFGLTWISGFFGTNLGNVYGYGTASGLGVNSTSSVTIHPPKKLDLSNIIELSAGAGWTVAVTKDGKVYGTGTNNYGILGRWIGIDRKSPNSRYKTAFEWVECPELEI